MTLIHILRTPEITYPWWPTNQRFPASPKVVITDCCCCKMRRADTISRLVTSWEMPLGGLGCYQEPAFYKGQKKEGQWAAADVPTGGYFEPRIEIRCAPSKGCNSNPKRLRGKHLREAIRCGI